MNRSFVRLLSLLLACSAFMAGGVIAHPSHRTSSPEYRLYLKHHTTPYYPKYFHEEEQTCHASHMGKIYHGELRTSKCYFNARGENFSAAQYEVIKH